MNAEPERPGGSGVPAAPAGAAAGDRRGGPVLNLEHLTLSFGGLRAISELDLQVADREVVSVIGPNGAGKTTVFNVITGIYEPSSGMSASRGSRSPESSLTASPGWGSRARSRACGCS